AEAWLAGIRSRDVKLQGDWSAGLWKSGFKLRLSYLTDGNRCVQGEARFSRGFLADIGPRVVYVETFEDMARLSTAYYSPNRLQEHQLGLEWPWRIHENYELSTSYLPGVGRQAGTEIQFIHNLNGRLEIH